VPGHDRYLFLCTLRRGDNYLPPPDTWKWRRNVTLIYEMIVKKTAASDGAADYAGRSRLRQPAGLHPSL
jgi:hypothetical protein